jgi:hypothetical protein
MIYLFRAVASTAAAVAAASAGCHLLGSIFSMPFAIAYSVGWSLVVAVLWAAIAMPRSTS